MLKDVNLSKHNVMHLTKANDQGQGDGKRPNKRPRLGSYDENSNEDGRNPYDHDSPQLSSQRPSLIKADPDASDDADDLEHHISARKTDLETALPPIDTDSKAIAAYEASQVTESDVSCNDRLAQRKWTPGKSSIYVDAFNLALDTVLEDESHLFDTAESSVFRSWRNLSYEAQYLYVALWIIILFAVSDSEL